MTLQETVYEYSGKSPVLYCRVSIDTHHSQKQLPSTSTHHPSSNSLPEHCIHGSTAVQSVKCSWDKLRRAYLNLRANYELESEIEEAHPHRLTHPTL